MARSYRLLHVRDREAVAQVIAPLGPALRQEYKHAVAALAIVCIDNPMLPGTGHRICNDCMKACIFQKQEPVNIPQIETSALTDVLALPYGFEVYGLLTRWNPLNARRPSPRPYHGHDVLVVGITVPTEQYQRQAVGTSASNGTRAILATISPTCD